MHTRYETCTGGDQATGRRSRMPEGVADGVRPIRRGIARTRRAERERDGAGQGGVPSDDCLGVRLERSRSVEKRLGRAGAQLKRPHPGFAASLEGVEEIILKLGLARGRQHDATMVSQSRDQADAHDEADAGRREDAVLVLQKR